MKKFFKTLGLSLFLIVTAIPVSAQIINFADSNVKAICVANWDTDGDGELSYEEAATVTELGQVFKDNTDIVSFDELQYFIGLTKIDDSAFFRCISLTSVIFPKNLTVIGDYAFWFCLSLNSLTIHNRITFLTGRSFEGCSSLSSIIVEDGNPVYDSRNDCNAIIETVSNTLVVGCDKTVIPSEILRIGSWAFACRYSLTSIDLPDGVNQIDTHAFYGCDNLRSIAIPKGVTELPYFAFHHDYGNPLSSEHLLTVILYGDNLFNVDSSNFPNRANATLYVPFGSKAAYEVADVWKDFKEIIEMPDNLGIEFADAAVKAICVQNWDTDGDGELSEVEAAAVTSLGANVFKDNTDITSFDELQYFTGLTSIEQSAFSGCSNLRSVSLPEGLQSIKNDAFMNSGIESITFPSSLTSVGLQAFKNCSRLGTIDFNRCPAYFESNCFGGCTSLEELFIPNTVSFRNSDWTWSWDTFKDCKSLRTVVFEPFETGQGRWSSKTIFNNCTALKTVVLPSTSVMEHGVFSNCSSLQSVTYLEVQNDFDSRLKNFNKMYLGLDADKIQFTIPEGTAEMFLKAGYLHLSDMSGLPLVRSEFEATATRITAMAAALTESDNTALTNAISEARTIVNSAADYATVYNQIAAIKDAAKALLTSTTIPKNFDVTAAFITNPDCDNLQLGWNTVGGWVSWPNNNRRGWNESEYVNGEVTMDKFIDIYDKHQNRTLENSTIEQTIVDLPAGIWRLESDAIATWQDDASVTVTGVNLFAGIEKTNVATENEKPQHFSVKFENPVTQAVKIGIGVNTTNANWVALDNVRLYYEGAAAAQPQGIDLVSDENARVYLYNVETGKYLSSGHSYGTHALLDEAGLPIRLTQDEETGLWQIYFWEGASNQQLLFCQNGNAFVNYSSVQHGSAGNPWWSFTQAADGSYFIHNSALGEDCYLGNDPTRQDSQAGDYSGVSYTDVNANVSADKNVRWLILTKESSDLQTAKRRLMSTILRMEGSEQPNEDLLATAQMVYDDGDATLDEVIGIITILNSQMGMPKDNQPVDMTALITNPRFENNTTEGWSGANVVGGRVDATSNNEQEFWQTNFNMYQTIMGVPNGRYLVKWKGFHCPGNFEDNYNAYSEGTDNASAVVYANGVQKTMKNHASDGSSQSLHWGEYSFGGNYFPNIMESTRVYFDAGHYADQLEVVVTDNVLTIGVKNTEEMGTRHWVVFSDFELFILENADQMNNKFTIGDITSVPGGSAVLPIELNNTDVIVSFQAEVRLPEGVTPKTDAQGNIIVKTSSRVPMTVLGNMTADGVCRFAALFAGQPIQGNEGEAFSFTIHPSAEMELGDYELQVTNVKLVNEDLLRIQPFNSSATLTLREASSGDVNGDGEVDVLDATMIVYYVIGRNPNINLNAADVNGDGEIDILDSTIIVYRYLGRDAGLSSAGQMMQMEAE